MFSFEGIQRMAVHSVLSSAFDGQRCAGPVSDPTALQRLLTGTRYVAAWHLGLSETECTIVASHMQPRRLVLRCSSGRFVDEFQRTLFSCASGTRQRQSQRIQIGMAAAAKCKLGPEVVPQLQTGFSMSG